MPCHDPYADEQSRRETRKKVHNLTRMLCDLCMVMEQSFNGETIDCVEGLREWWNDHQVQDRVRAATEEAAREAREFRQKVLDKLTPEEILALGL